jgi:hypothetical protein
VNVQGAPGAVEHKGAKEAIESHFEFAVSPHPFAVPTGPVGACDVMLKFTPLVSAQPKILLPAVWDVIEQVPAKLASQFVGCDESHIPLFKNCAKETVWPTSKSPPVIVELNV